MIGRFGIKISANYFLLLVAFIAFLALSGGCSPSVSEDTHDEKRIYRLFCEIDDGDTIRYGGVTMRFLGVDTPEIRHPAVGIYIDQPYGRKAKAFCRQEIKKARRVTYSTDGRDRYGRLLVHLFVDGYPLSLKLVEAGLAYETVSAFGDNGFPEIAQKILNASRLHPTLPFEKPYVWRKRHQIRQ